MSPTRAIMSAPIAAQFSLVRTQSTTPIAAGRVSTKQSKVLSPTPPTIRTACHVLRYPAQTVVVT